MYSYVYIKKIQFLVSLAFSKLIFLMRKPVIFHYRWLKRYKAPAIFGKNSNKTGSNNIYYHPEK